MILGQYVVMMSCNESFPHFAESDIKCHGKLKLYPNGDWELLACSRPIFSAAGWELSDKWDSKPSPRKKTEASADDLDRARRRAASKVKDIARCTPFKWFVTLTIDAKQIDRYDPSAILKRMRVWLDNRVRRNGLAYVLVPEYHKDGAIHFHGFFNDSDIGIVESGTFRLMDSKKPRRPRSEAERASWIAAGAQAVYNVADWGFGFSTAIAIYGDYNAAIGYCCKYVTKAQEKIGGRWYYSGGKLGAPDVEYLDCDFRDIAADPRSYQFSVDAAGAAFVLLRGQGRVDIAGGAAAAK